MNYNLKYFILYSFFFVLNAPYSYSAMIETPRPISGNDPESLEQIVPADVLARSLLLRDELELIRFEMGRAKSKAEPLNIDQAAPREVYFQARALYQNANRFCFEHTRTRKVAPEIPEGKISPRHVWLTVDDALKRILLVKKKLGITKKIKERIQDKKTTPSQVFIAMVQDNRQINLMLDKQIQPEDVFQQVTLAINYTERLLAQFPGVERIPEAPKFENGKVPLDVYKRLLKGFDLLVEIFQTSNVPVLKLNLKIDEVTKAAPSDVFNLSALIVSEVAYLNGFLKSNKSIPQVYYPGRKFPSHVYQRAGILLNQLNKLNHQVKSNPNWLTVVNSAAKKK